MAGQAEGGSSVGIDFGGLKTKKRTFKGGVFIFRGKPLEGLGEAAAANGSQIASAPAVLAQKFGPPTPYQRVNAKRDKLFGKIGLQKVCPFLH